MLTTVSAVFEGHVIKVKVERDIAVPADSVELQLPAEKLLCFTQLMYWSHRVVLSE